MQELNIVELIENNPISKLSQTYNSKLISKIQEIFTGFEQQLFVSSFYCYLNYNKNTDFVVDLDNVWKWLGFSQKIRAKECIEKYFKIDIDYKSAFSDEKAVSEQEKNLFKIVKQDSNIKQNGGQNIKKIFLTVKCFKSLCLKAQTKKAAEIHEYYIKLEEVLHEIVEEETDELRLQLEQKDNIILEIKEDSEKIKKDSLKSVEQAIINQFPLNTECIYIGSIDNTNEANEKLIKFGQTNNLSTRVNDHRKTYDNFILITAFRVQNKAEIEGLIKTSNKIRRQIRNVEIKGQIRRELIAYDPNNFTSDKLIQYIKDIINSKIYNIDNFNKLLKQNEDLEARVRELEKENEELKEQLSPKILNKSISAITNSDNQFVYQDPSIPIELIINFNEFIDTMCVVRYDVEETSTNIEGQFRIWLRTKPQKEIFHTFKQYLETRFKRARLTKQDSTNVVYGYVGVKIKPIEYKKQFVGNDIETFLFQSCKFSPSGKILNSVLFEEYKQWNQKLNKEVTDVNINELKEYLKNCEYVIKSVVWTDIGSNDGYYGISLKNKEYVKKVVSTTGKKVEKIELSTGYILDTWDTIAKAAVSENISAAKMSRSIKNNVMFNDYFYRIQAE
jgi:hypothetical protein